MRRNTIELLTGFLVLVIAIGFLGYAIAHSGTGPTGNGYTLYASFNNIAGLNVGSDVRLAGVKVGAVDAASVDPKTYLARVAMKIRDGIELPKDSGAAISTESLLGGEYIAISPGGDSEMLKAGQSITVTQGAVSLEDLLGKFIFSATNMVSAMTSDKSNQQSHPGQTGPTNGTGSGGLK